MTFDNMSNFTEGPRESKQICREHPMPAHCLQQTDIFDPKNGLLHSQRAISMVYIYIYAIFETSSLASIVFEIFTLSEFITLKVQVKVMMYNIHSGALRGQISELLSDGNINIFIFQDFAYQNGHNEQFDIENVGEGHTVHLK